MDFLLLDGGVEMRCSHTADIAFPWHTADDTLEGQTDHSLLSTHIALTANIPA